MKIKWAMLLPLILISNLCIAQTLHHKYTPYIYIGAPKTFLTELVVGTAKIWYEKDWDGVIDKQRKKGIKLKKKEVLDAFIAKMQADIRYKLEQSNYWEDDEVDLSPWNLSIKNILGLGFNLPGFTDKKIKLHPEERDYVSLWFKNGSVAQINAEVPVATIWDTRGHLYDNKTLQRCIDILSKVYGTNYSHSRKTGDSFLGEKSFRAYTEILSYNTSSLQMHFQFYYGPCGWQDKAGNWSHAGTTLQRIMFNVQSK